MLPAELVISQSPLEIRGKLKGNWVHVDLFYTWLRNKGLHFPDFSYFCLSIAAYTGEMHRCFTSGMQRMNFSPGPGVSRQHLNLGKKDKRWLLTGLPLITVTQAIFLALFDPK